LRSIAPRARNEELVIEELDDELLLYDLRTDAAHCLDPQATAIWRACDGTASVAEIAAATGTTDEAVEHTLADLAERDLVEGIGYHSRRDAFKYALTAGAVGVALPIVKSIVAPTAAQAQSCLADGSTCSVDSECCSNNCNVAVCGPPL
jgi:coenzyme PQQ synthesis protein D (PqqD)